MPEPVKTKMKPSDQFLSDVTITAVEGGIGYWSQVRKYKFADNEEFPTTVDVRETEQDNPPKPGPWKSITIKEIEDAILKIQDDHRAGKNHCHPTYIKKILAGYYTDDGGDIDSDLADIIMQVACLGQVIYG